MTFDITRIVSNTLSNIYDWESKDLRNDFIYFLSSEYQVSEEKLGIIFDQYNSLSPIIRESVTFDLNEFVSKLMN